MRFSPQFKKIMFWEWTTHTFCVFRKGMLGIEKGRDPEFSVAEAKHCQVKQEAEWAYPHFM
jgi:hypothetical protein